MQSTKRPNNGKKDEPMERKKFKTSCEKCRKRKIKCDNTQPCSTCRAGNFECTYIGSGEKRRPIHRAQVQALQGQIEFLETFITRLIAADTVQRDELLRNYAPRTGNSRPSPHSSLLETSATKTIALPIRSHAGHLRRSRDGNAAQFYGPTSVFHISPTEPSSTLHIIDDAQGATRSLSTSTDELPISTAATIHTVDPNVQLAFSPHSEICRQLIATFFHYQYQYHMCLYREWFLRDFHNQGGPYYSDLLLYSICAMGALASEKLARRELSGMFVNRAQELLYGGALEQPCLTTIQALILLGHREMGQGKTPKGWVFSGMAFRMAHEMGLHLDPSNWPTFASGSTDFRIEREILRRTYWAAFIADKQLSLYFGRPPALYPGESDVQNTERIPYPAEFKFLLTEYILQGTQVTSEADYEDGLALVAGWIHHVELCKIMHRMITEVFENRNGKTDETVLAASVLEINVTLTKWLNDLPKSLHWNNWSSNDIRAFVLQLHMQYHTAMIILHRPPKQTFQDPGIATSQNVKNCYESLDFIIKLLGIFRFKKHDYSHLPFTFIHILATAASTVLMKRQIGDLPWDSTEIDKPLKEILLAFDGISETWPCATQIREMIESALNRPPKFENEDRQFQSPPDFDFTNKAIGQGNTQVPFDEDFDFGMATTEMGDFEPAFFDEAYQWGNGWSSDPTLQMSQDMLQAAPPENIFNFEDLPTEPWTTNTNLERPFQ
ncbi:fungal-specific transcription factor domain-containing protein [Halenospora varia]|nr:fungal-specific transcription factor domain-containing protein [Halenospora varia]